MRPIWLVIVALIKRWHIRTLARLACLSRSLTMILCNPNSVNTICRKQHPSRHRRGWLGLQLPLLQRYAAQSHPSFPSSQHLSACALHSFAYCQRIGKVQRRLRSRQHKVESNKNRKQNKTHFINNLYRLRVHFEIALRASWLRFGQSFLLGLLQLRYLHS